jgi:ferredoxin
MDVCLTKVIDMRINKGKTIEGDYLTYLEFSGAANKELVPGQMMTFPFMANAELCDGCMICVNECPTTAIDIVNNVELKNHYQREVVYET